MLPNTQSEDVEQHLLLLGFITGGAHPIGVLARNAAQALTYVGTARMDLANYELQRLSTLILPFVQQASPVPLPVRINALWLRPHIPVLVRHSGTRDRLRRATLVRLLLNDSACD